MSVQSSHVQMNKPMYLLWTRLSWVSETSDRKLMYLMGDKEEKIGEDMVRYRLGGRQMKLYHSGAINALY